MDIVERLRCADGNSVQRALGSDIFGAAADEIERLRSLLCAVDNLPHGDEPPPSDIGPYPEPPNA